MKVVFFLFTLFIGLPTFAEENVNLDTARNYTCDYLYSRTNCERVPGCYWNQMPSSCNAVDPSYGKGIACNTASGNRRACEMLSGSHGCYWTEGRGFCSSY